LPASAGIDCVKAIAEKMMPAAAIVKLFMGVNPPEDLTPSTQELLRSDKSLE
jgi:hypothetical protein